MYHVVFHNHPLPVRQAVAPGASAPLSSAPAAASSPTASTQGAAPLTLPSALALPDGSGTLHRLAEYRGRPLVLNFWATWCEPCRRELPLLQALHQQRGDSVRIVGVAVDFQKDVLPYVQSKGISYPQLMGEKDGLAAVNAFGMEPAFPFTVFADSRGNIVAVKVGELHADEAGLILAQVTALDAGKLSLPQARSAVSAGLRSLAIARAQQPVGATAVSGGKS
jgi:thiol-disulfide isomerase/thioredoxin